MKKYLLPAAAALVIMTGINAHAQAPQGISYQAIARNSEGAVLSSETIGVRFTIHDSVATGTALYRETFSPTTTASGLFTLQIGTGMPVAGTFAGINWGRNSKFLQVELLPPSAAHYIDMGTQQMMSVPYALYAQTAGGGAGWADSAGNLYNTNTGNVGIGTTTPKARLHVADSSVVFTSPATTATVASAGLPPASGAGSRMMWYADKAAFRVGNVTGNEWDRENIGNFSFAAGYNTVASGSRAVATGWGSIASGFYSLASGYKSISSGAVSTALGDSSVASGSRAFASGEHCIASGDGAVALGFYGQATGARSFAVGDDCKALADYAIAMGSNSLANAAYSVAIGKHASVNGKTGAFVLGDASASGFTGTASTADNQMSMRFAGGYRLFTNGTSTTGVSIAPGGNSWATISDRRKKENFSTVDGEAFLKKIAKMELTSWNYIGQDPSKYRHYGPMAQDFYAAFGNDGVGTIGNDTTINQADMEGVSFVAIQALVQRTEDLKKENELLKQQLAQYKQENSTLKAEITHDRQETNARLHEIELMLRKENTASK